MFVSKVSYMKRRNLGNYEHVEVAVEVMNNTEAPVTAEELAQFAEEATMTILGRAKTSVPPTQSSNGARAYVNVQDTSSSGQMAPRSAPAAQRYGGNTNWDAFTYEVNMPFIRNKDMRDQITKAMKDAGYKFNGERNGGNNHWYGNSPVLHPQFDDKWYIKSAPVGAAGDDDNIPWPV